PSALQNRKDYSYNYTASGGVFIGDRLHPIGGDACGIAFASTKMGLSLEIRPGDGDRYGDDTFGPDSSHPGVMRSTTWGKCMFRVVLPLSGMTGAPKSMRDPSVQVTPMNVADETWNLDDTSLCSLAEALAADIAARVRDGGVPVHARHRSTAAKFLTG